MMSFRLEECKKLDPPYDLVIFNFPHVGLGIKDQVRVAFQLCESERCIIGSFNKNHSKRITAQCASSQLRVDHFAYCHSHNN
jgi:hypothetical protein